MKTALVKVALFGICLAAMLVPSLALAAKGRTPTAAARNTLKADPFLGHSRWNITITATPTPTMQTWSAIAKFKGVNVKPLTAQGTATRQPNEGGRQVWQGFILQPRTLQ
jgi:hypothetical protein